MTRRVFPKGTNFDRISVSAIQDAEEWQNNYPRGIFDFSSSNDVFGTLKKIFQNTAKTT